MEHNARSYTVKQFHLASYTTCIDADVITMQHCPARCDIVHSTENVLCLSKHRCAPRPLLRYGRLS